MYIRGECFGIVTGQILSVFDSYLPAIHKYFHFRTMTSKNQLIFTKLGMCIDIIEIWGDFSSIFELSACHTIVAGYYRFTFYL